MQTQTEGFNDVFDKLLAQQQAANPPKRPSEDKARRYVWYLAEDQPHQHVIGGWIERGRVTPILPFKLWERAMDVPEHLRIDVRGMSSTGKESFGECAYELQPGWIFDHVIVCYEMRGLRELRDLYDRPLREVMNLGLDKLFIPWRKSRKREIDEIPKPYRIVRQHIESVLNDNKDKLIRKVGEDMLLSIAASEAYDSVFLDEEESRDPIKYSHPGFRALSRLERRHKDKALQEMASVQNAVFARLPDILTGQTQADPALVEFIKGQQQQIELLTQLVADKQKK